MLALCTDELCSPYVLMSLSALQERFLVSAIMVISARDMTYRYSIKPIVEVLSARVLFDHKCINWGILWVSCALCMRDSYNYFARVRLH